MVLAEAEGPAHSQVEMGILPQLLQVVVTQLRQIHSKVEMEELLLVEHQVGLVGAVLMQALEQEVIHQQARTTPVETEEQERLQQ